MKKFQVIRTVLYIVAGLLGANSGVVHAEAVEKVGVCHVTGQPEDPNYKILWVPKDTAESHVSNHFGDVLLDDNGLCGAVEVGGCPCEGLNTNIRYEFLDSSGNQVENVIWTRWGDELHDWRNAQNVRWDVAIGRLNIDYTNAVPLHLSFLYTTIEDSDGRLFCGTRTRPQDNVNDLEVELIADSEHQITEAQHRHCNDQLYDICEQSNYPCSIP